MKLTRTCNSSHGTFGVLSIDEKPVCITCEPVIPIPEGTYNCIPHDGPKFQNVWELQNVPGHTAILIHQGNSINDTHGCILVGAAFVTNETLAWISNSVVTLNNLRQILPQDFELKITNAF